MTATANLLAKRELPLDECWGNVVGNALSAGRLVATLQSKLTGAHITVQFRCKSKVAGRWRWMPLHLASHVFIDVPNSGGWADRVATVYPPEGGQRWAGWLFPDPNADPARVWAALKILEVARGDAPMSTDQYELVLAERCLRCGKELTEPESIEALMGPHCRQVVSKEYGVRHHKKKRVVRASTEAAMPASPEPAVPAAVPTGVLPPGCTETIDLSGDLRAALGIKEATS